MRDVIVIGCGIVGATVAKVLTKQGRNVLVLDDGRPMSGTAPSGGHLKPSWFGGMKKEQSEPAMELLSETWGMTEEEFTVLPDGSKTTVYRVDTDQVVKYPRMKTTVTGIKFLNNYPIVQFTEAEERTKLLIVAAGAWCGELLPEISVQARQGVSFRLKGKLQQPIIQQWAPYKQIVAHQQAADEIWVGDGSALLPANWTEERTRQCLGRCREALHLGSLQPTKTLIGWRPYCKTEADPCLLRKLFPRVWVATGAGKMGTIAAGWVAGRILDATS